MNENATITPYRQPAPDDPESWINHDDEARLWAAVVVNLPGESVVVATKRADALVAEFRARRVRGEALRTARYEASLAKGRDKAQGQSR